MIAASTTIASATTQLVNEVEPVVYFDTKVAHLYIIGFAVFAILWGLVNVLLVSDCVLTVCR